MGNTPNWNIYYKDTLDPESTVTESAVQAGTIEDALDTISGQATEDRYYGIVDFPNAGARDAEITSPEVNYLTQLTGEGFPRRWTGSTWAPWSIGLQPMIPSATSSTGGSISADTLTGIVSFSGCSVVNIDGVFSDDSSGMDEYQVVLKFSHSTGATTSFQFRASGTPDTSSNYDRQVISGISTAAAAAQSLAASSWNTSGVNNTLERVWISLSDPALAEPTTAMMNTLAFANPVTSSHGIVLAGLLHRSSTAFDGLALTPGSGTISGIAAIRKVR